MKKQIFLFVVGILFLSGCSIYHLNSEETSDEFYPSKNMSDVIYLENVTQPHDVIGTVTVNTERNQEFDEVVAKMKREAAIMGGDAITNIRTDATGLWKKVPPHALLKNAYVRANFTATVVVLK